MSNASKGGVASDQYCQTRSGVDGDLAEMMAGVLDKHARPSEDTALVLTSCGAN